MTNRLKKYFDVFKYFLNDIDSIDALIVEAKNTQVYLGEIIALKLEISRDYSRASREYEREYDKARDHVYTVLKKQGASSTDSIVKSKVEYVFGEKLAALRENKEHYRIELECVQDIYFAMMQRKDIIVEIINRWKFKDEYESCLIKNKEFIGRLMRNL